MVIDPTMLVGSGGTDYGSAPLDWLLAGIAEAFDDDTTVYIEGDPPTAVRELLAENSIEDEYQIKRQTTWPRRSSFRVPASASLINRVRQLASPYDDTEICDHIVVYFQGEPLLAAFDIGADAHIWFANSLPTDVVTRLIENIGRP